MRHEAKLLLVKSAGPLSKRLEQAEKLVWASYDINKSYEQHQQNGKQLLDDILLLFSIRMMNDQLKSYYGPYSTALAWINKAKLTSRAKEKLLFVASEMVQTGKRPLAKQYFTDIFGPIVAVDVDRVEEINIILDKKWPTNR